MNYAEAMEYLAEAGRRGIVPGLDTVRSLLHYLNDPQQKLRFVHVAGTNGKGSTTAMTASILQQAGYTVGRYTSPAVFCDREKYAVNGEWISETAYAEAMTEVACAIERMAADGCTLPTSFEVETALAMLHFLHSSCDIVVLETGMGGLMDATNVVENTLVCILTAIGMDHTRFLGGSIAEIASQKAGIIKPGCAVVLEKQSEEVRRIIESACAEKHASLTVTESDAVCAEVIPGGQRFTYRTLDVTLPLLGSFQPDNAAGAIDAALQLRRAGWNISDEAIKEGLLHVSWPGRLQRIHSNPDIYIDGAHNPNAAVRLAQSIPLLWPGRPLICIMGVLADKDFTEVARLVCAQARSTVTVTPVNPRALDAAALAEAISPVCPHTETASDAQDALRRAAAMADADSVILAFGSLSYLNDIVTAAKELN